MKWHDHYFWYVMGTLFFVFWIARLLAHKDTSDMWASGMACFAMARIKKMEDCV